MINRLDRYVISHVLQLTGIVGWLFWRMQKRAPGREVALAA